MPFLVACFPLNWDRWNTLKNHKTISNIDRMDPDPKIEYVEGNARRIRWKANNIKSKFRRELILAVGKEDDQESRIVKSSK